MTLPLWLLILILAFAGVTFASHFLFPSVRWFFRKRAERVVARINARLARPIDAFKLARRSDLIQRLTYDSEVLQAVAIHASKAGIPEEVALERARDYAREIVPGFSATLYFGLATRLARWLSRALYRVRIVERDPGTAVTTPDGATVVYVMNHRSNMDYVLATYLTARSTALSYAVGEWARTWPLGRLIRALGGYFIRRGARGELYRRVLARYVQIATARGLTQAVFPEGGLSLDGTIGTPRLGIINYIVTGAGDREVAFVPVGINYDRVFEDKILLAAYEGGERRFRVGKREALAIVWRFLRRRFADHDYRFGLAAVSFGQPVILSALRAEGHENLTETVGAVLMDRIRSEIPVLPVPLVAHVLGETGDLAEDELIRRVQALATGIGNHPIYPHAGMLVGGIQDALANLARRRIVRRQGGTVSVVSGEDGVLAYYARSIAHIVAPAEPS